MQGEEEAVILPMCGVTGLHPQLHRSVRHRQAG